MPDNKQDTKLSLDIFNNIEGATAQVSIHYSIYFTYQHFVIRTCVRNSELLNIV